LKTILIVEDEPDVSQALTLALEMEGFAIENVSNGREALAKLEEMQPDLILSDVMMPELTGIEMVEEIRKSRHRSVPVILMSAGYLDEDERGAAVEFLRKPLDLANLLAAIRGQSR